MSNPSLAALLKHLRKLVSARTPSERPDEQLLQRFIAERDEGAFAALLQRHGLMVLNVCCRVLGRAEDVEDAFQATFLVLARKAASIRKPGAIGSWLHGVAYRIAKQVRAAGIPNMLGDRGDQPAPQAEPHAELTWRDVRRVLDEELQRLPSRYREPLVLCYLEDRTQDEAAKQLDWSKSTLRRRLQQGRALLQVRLTRRGLSLSVALLGTLLTPTSASSVLPGELARTTLLAVLRTAGGEGVGLAMLSVRVTALADGLIRALSMAKLQMVIMIALVAGLVAVGAGLWIGAARTTPPRVVPEDSAQVVMGPPAQAANQKGDARTDAYGESLPDGVQARMGTTRLSVGSVSVASLIHGLGFAPDGKSLASASDGSVRIWDPATGKTVLCLEARGGQVFPIAFAPDGTSLATSGLDGTIRLWNLSAGTPMREFRGHAQKVFGLIFSSDGQTLASGGTDRTLRLWKVATGEEISRLDLRATGTPVRVSWPVMFLPDNLTVATRDLNYGIGLWDVLTGKELRRLEWLPENVRAVALAPNGRLVAAAEANQTGIRLWRLDGEELGSLRGHAGQVEALVFSTDSSTLASGSVDGTIRMWDVATGTEMGRLQTDEAGAEGLAFSPDGKLLASQFDTKIRLWKAATGQELHATSGHRSPILAVVFLPDNRRLLSAETRGSIFLWDAITGGPRGDCKRSENDPPLAAAFSREGAMFASAGTAGTIRVSSPLTGAELCSWKAHNDWIFSLAFAPDGRTLVSGGRDKALALWEPLTAARRPGSEKTKIKSGRWLTRPMGACWHAAVKMAQFGCEKSPLGKSYTGSAGRPPR